MVYNYNLLLDSCASTLTISRDTARCISQAAGFCGLTTRIEITQTLQKKKNDNGWINMDKWNFNYDGYSCLTNNKKDDLPNGIYRLKTVFSVYSQDVCEMHTKLSNEVFCLK